MILNFEKYVRKMLKTKFWLRNKSTFIQLPDAEKNEVSKYKYIQKLVQIIFYPWRNSDLF